MQIYFVGLGFVCCPLDAWQVGEKGKRVIKTQDNELPRGPELVLLLAFWEDGFDAFPSHQTLMDWVAHALEARESLFSASS